MTLWLEPLLCKQMAIEKPAPFPVAIYARVSTGRQDSENQIQELREFVSRSGWTVFREYTDEGYSGKDTKRPAFKKMMEHAKERRFKAVIVWKLDRLSRSLKDLVLTIEEFNGLGIDFVSYANHLDTTTPSGKLLFQIMGAVAEFEREIIRERVQLGQKNDQTERETPRTPSDQPGGYGQGKETPRTRFILSENF
ncbi:recombinase family protein [bacterium]|nr:MAG: recombinase family protein [bacterium]